MAVERHEHPVGCVTIFFLIYFMMTSCEVGTLKWQMTMYENDFSVCAKRIEELEARVRAIEPRPNVEKVAK